MGNLENSRPGTSSLVKSFLLLAGGILLISFGGMRLSDGASGIIESITLIACIASGISLLIVVGLEIRRIVNGRTRTH